MLPYVLAQGNSSVTSSHRSMMYLGEFWLPWSVNWMLTERCCLVTEWHLCNVSSNTGLELGHQSPPRDGFFQLLASTHHYFCLLLKNSPTSIQSMSLKEYWILVNTSNFFFPFICQYPSKTQNWDEMRIWGACAWEHLCRKLQLTAGRGTERILNSS